MGEVPVSISLLRFCAGTLQLGIAAEDVRVGQGVASSDQVHIASLLGVEPSGAAPRVVILPRPAHFEDGPESFSLMVDTPLQVQLCDAESLLPLPRGVSFEKWKPVMGFAQLEPHLVLLLDIPTLFATFMDRYHQRGCA